MKKIISIILVLAMSVLLLTGCAGNSTGDDTIVLKLQTLENEDHAQGLLMQAFKEELESLSGGQIEVQLYYNASLYTQDGAIPALISGDLEMTLTSFQVTADYLPSMAMFGADYVFKSYDHMRSVMDSEIGRTVAQQIKEAAGYIPVGYAYNGSRQLNLVTDEPVMTPADMEGVVLRMPSAEAWIAAGEALGASVSPLAYGEVYMGLSTGAIDAQDNPMAATKSSKFYEVTNQISLTYHIIDAIMLVMNDDVWDSLTAEQQGWVSEAAAAAVKVGDEAQLNAEQELISFFEDEGLVITEPDIDAFAEYAKNYYEEKGLMEVWDMDLYEQIQNMA